MVQILLVVAVVLSAVSAVLGFLGFTAAKRAEAAAMSDDLADMVEAALRRELGQMRLEFDSKSATQRQELAQALSANAGQLGQQLSALTASFDTRLTAFAEIQQKTGSDLAETQSKRLSETNQAVAKLSEALQVQQKEGREAMTLELEKVRATVGKNLETLRKDNEEKLEKMRATVEEKLQGTLEQRLGESFKQVSDRLEAVHKGLGEMQSLASGVGDLKRVLTNVKTRGGWGEMQLGAILEEMLAPEQYVSNTQIDPSSAQRVEFAVRMPGQGDGEPILLPIDAKFPHEDYDRLLTAQDLGDMVQIDAAAKQLERAVRLQAKTISDSYIKPPYSTDFAVMYLPTEGLYAEVARRPGLIREIQTQHRVMVAGPSNLAAFLNSLQMGFRTLAIQKRSSEVWQVLGAAKAEFQKYGDVWDKLGKQLDTARKTVDEAGKRTRAVERRLRGVEVLDAPVASTLLEAPDAEDMADL
ncbi:MULTISPECIES: DNA recombination protein RmuC [unclassified Brevundimonas]|uniref:DNA recombination protein RmuC n=1 Tax=unclassified Brevundimonas TaxID=2622653 RepID=UPI0025BA4822|nr:MULTISPECIES: DNA recombination protein RmuC [unclassified Brevundimonas]